MTTEQFYRLAADLLLVLHSAFVVFVIIGLVAILIGYRLGWHWVRNRRFRQLHLAAIGLVVLEAWIGMICPLTRWEMELRQLAGDSVYQGSFIQHWLHNLLYYDLPEWVFIVGYSLFGLLVLTSWWLCPPNRPRC